MNNNAAAGRAAQPFGPPAELRLDIYNALLSDSDRRPFTKHIGGHSYVKVEGPPAAAMLAQTFKTTHNEMIDLLYSRLAITLDIANWAGNAPIAYHDLPPPMFAALSGAQAAQVWVQICVNSDFGTEVEILDDVLRRLTPSMKLSEFTFRMKVRRVDGHAPIESETNAELSLLRREMYGRAGRSTVEKELDYAAAALDLLKRIHADFGERANTQEP